MLDKRMYDVIIKEHFDITDRDTRKILINVNEQDQNKILSSLTSRLYDNIVEKVLDIDFGSIPETKGDITKVENYDNMIDCLNIITDMLIEYKQPLTSVRIITQAIDNIKDRKELFEKAFYRNVELPMVLYSTIVLSIVSSTSLFISSCIEFIKSSSDDTFEVSLDKVALKQTSSNLLFKNLDKFNKSCENNQFDKSLEVIINKNSDNLTGSLLTTSSIALTLGFIVVNIIPLLKELVYFYYHTKLRISDYFNIQANLLQVNAHNLEISDGNIPSKDKKKIVDKQMKIVALFKKISNFFDIEYKKSEVSVKKEVSKDKDVKIKTSDILDSAPDSSTSSLF